ncbi:MULTISPECIES: Crp/Fnr family transcriptional regulator [Chryseobacterium]|uniref:Crp/Fnr family transcriptional regulator n=1 Tax=Chryseobacterium TaxID=59732 RepID=UPI001625171F|nr:MULTISPECIES: cyclic nucleotide-binding domain-containing protein [Chryseobacterium]MBF6643950.1 cyclic nucleotide-binding domain-containing protein [Chryseobacterium indologenes]MBU3046816.1 cyclic nucleotide-binding domain-containing protein [Chryseobacterium indologenes]QQQ72323.1 cyclic nucleotide-binding domain-containing protein [Chryseobacterium indologenes]
MDILNTLGHFTPSEIKLFEQHTRVKRIERNQTVLNEGEICRSFYYILSGSFIQYRMVDIDEVITDLHLKDEWMYNHQSLINQTLSLHRIKAFNQSEVLELTLENYHFLLSSSLAFVQLNKILDQDNHRTFLFDHNLSPADRYLYLQKTKPDAVKIFPVKSIASYLKIAPETLSRIRAKR